MPYTNRRQTGAEGEEVPVVTAEAVVSEAAAAEAVAAEEETIVAIKFARKLDTRTPARGVPAARAEAPAPRQRRLQPLEARIE